MPYRNIPKTLAGLALAAAAAVALACGPAAPAGQDATSMQPPTLDPTTRAKVESLVKEELATATKPTPTPKSVEPDADDKPTPTRHPGDPAKPAPTATPARTGTPTPKAPPPTPLVQVPHPDGLYGCKRHSMFLSPTDEVAYLSWCGDAIADQIWTECNGAHDADEAIACAQWVLSDVKNYSTREGVLQCIAIPDRSERVVCNHRVWAEYTQNMRMLWHIWAEVREAVSQTPEVKAKYREVLGCLTKAGYKDPKEKLLFPWHLLESGDAIIARREVYTDAERKSERDLMGPTDRCARQVGLYDTQAGAWLAEIHRLVPEEPEKGELLVAVGILEAFETLGGSFLHGPATETEN